MFESVSFRPSSQIRRCVRDGVVVFEKQYTTDDWGGSAEVVRKRAAREFELIQQLHLSGQFRRRLGLVEVADCDPDAATISTREINGKSLEEWIFSAQQGQWNVLPWFLAGRWLLIFQQLPLADEAREQLSSHDPMDITDYCELRLRSLDEYGYHWPTEKELDRLLGAIKSFSKNVYETDKQLVWVHADYAPGNLMWGCGRLTPIDFAMARAGGPLDDATYLIHRLEMHRIYRPWSRLPISVYRRAILRGLKRPDAEGSAAYQLLMIKHLICRLHTYVRRPAKTTKQALHDRWVRAVIVAKLRKAIDRCGKASSTQQVSKS